MNYMYFHETTIYLDEDLDKDLDVFELEFFLLELEFFLLEELFFLTDNCIEVCGVGVVENV